MTNAEFLTNSEPGGYGEEIVSISGDNREIFVISDLHLAAGLNTNGNYDGTENFFADESLFRFLTYLKTIVPQNKKGLLIINGDFIDFLRIRSIPSSADDFVIWSGILKKLGVEKTPASLASSIIKKEREYGLRTDDYKSVWKLYTCFQGHQKVFQILSAWLHEGNELLIVKGNHDLEWVWKLVRDYFRLLLGTRQIVFADDKVLINGKIYLEHGHRYENFTSVDGDAILKNGTELNLPFGSFLTAT
jgi:UDP-2,3-diacylglucosamine pyrophosphatase LpxH